jgi:hypothetical protein
MTSSISRRSLLAGGAAALAFTPQTSFAAQTTPEKNIHDSVTHALREAAKNPHARENMVLCIDALATAYFAAKVGALTSPSFSRATPFSNQVGQNDYFTAIGFLAARCLVGGADVTHHTLEELKFGFKAALAAIGIGIAAEGMKADLNRISHAIKGVEIEPHQQIAGIALVSSLFSPYTMTIGSASMLGDEIRGLFPKSSAKLTDNEIKAMGVLMGHVGDHSALAPGLIGDPPDIPMMDLVGLEKMFELKLTYGSLPALYSLYSTTLKANYFLCGQDFAKARQLTHEGLMSKLPILPAMVKHSLENLAKHAFLQRQHPGGIHFDLYQRVGEALHNGYQSVMRPNPHNRHAFSHGAHPESDLIKHFGKSLTSYAQGQLDPNVLALEEILSSYQPADADRRRYDETLEHIESLIDPHKTEAGVKEQYDQFKTYVRRSYDQEQGDRIIALADPIYKISVLLHHKEPGMLESLTKLPARLTEKARLADAFGHSQMDVMTLLPWQILLSVPISNVQGRVLKTMTDANVSPVLTTTVNMFATMAVTGTVDNMAAFLAAAQASIKAGQPRLMQALMSSISAGSATWAGNPIAHGKIASESSIPSYSMADSVRALPSHLDIYGITAANVMAMDAMNMELRILGKNHPMYNSKLNGGITTRVPQLDPRGGPREMFWRAMPF